MGRRSSRHGALLPLAEKRAEAADCAEARRWGHCWGVRADEFVRRHQLPIVTTRAEPTPAPLNLRKSAQSAASGFCSAPIGTDLVFRLSEACRAAAGLRISLDGLLCELYSLAVSNTPKSPSGHAQVGTLSESLEDYLEIILQLQQEKRVARVRDIASRKGVSNASVSNALHRLARDGYVNHQAHEFVELTELGLDLARRILRRHEFLVSFLREVLQVSEKGAEHDACALEHHLSSETLERLASFYQFVSTCPRAGVNFLDAYKACCVRKEDSFEPNFAQLGCANPEHDNGGSVPEKCMAGGSEEDLLPLSELAPGNAGVVVRFKAPFAVRKRLVDAGLLPNVRVEVRRSGPDQRDVQLSVQGCEMVMEAGEAAAVLVRPVPIEDLA